MLRRSIFLLTATTGLAAAPAPARVLTINYHGQSTFNQTITSYGPTGVTNVRVPAAGQAPITGSFTIDLANLPARGGTGTGYFYTDPGTSPFLSSSFASSALVPYSGLGGQYGPGDKVGRTSLLFETGSFFPGVTLKSNMADLRGEQRNCNSIGGVCNPTTSIGTASAYNALTTNGPVPTMIVDGIVLPDFAAITDWKFESYYETRNETFLDSTGELQPNAGLLVSFARGTVSGISVSGLVSGIPEPTTWAMIMAGFGVVGGSLRRRRRVICTSLPSI